jgi:hypothetical protein
MYKIAIKVLCNLLFYVNSGISGIPEPEPELSVPEISDSVFSGWISDSNFRYPNFELRDKKNQVTRMRLQ